MKAISLYIHWPWCIQKCPYCDFNVRALAADSARNDKFKKYAHAIIKEYELFTAQYGPRQVETIFIGGGTPSTIPLDVLELLLTGITNVSKALLGSNYTPPIETTMEINPEHAAKNIFTSYKALGINRLSFGVQSFNDNELDFLGRRHSARQAINAIVMASACGLTNINVDLIFGTPVQTLTNWQASLEQAVALNVNHLSTYQLTIEKNTAFYKAVKQGTWAPIDDDTQLNYMKFAEDYLATYDYKYYEVSNACRDNAISNHNLRIWEYKEYWGLGAGAHGRVFNDNAVISTQNVKNPVTYLERVLNGTYAFSAISTLNGGEKALEWLLCKLRLRAPIKKQHIRNYYPHTDLEGIGLNTRLTKLLDSGYIELSQNTLALTPSGRDRVDSVAHELHMIFMHTK